MKTIGLLLLVRRKTVREIDQETDQVLGGCDLRSHACIFCRIVQPFSPFTQPKDLLIARFTTVYRTTRQSHCSFLFLMKNVASQRRKEEYTPQQKHLSKKKKSMLMPCLIHPKILKIFKIFRHTKH